jgi:hypothetical protein
MTHVRGILGSALLLVACGDKIAPDDSGPVDTDAPVEDCASGEDEDGDGLTDCEDEDCVGAAPCLEACTGGEDEDLDGLVDCADPDCVGQTVCIEDCTSGADEDRDGLTDCADPECVGIPACLEDCGSLRDEDVDGLIDCADPDCLATPDCSAETCDDRIDNEGDGLVDCLDPDCVADPSCDTSCADLVLTDPVPFQVTGSTSGQGNDINPGCATSSASDVAFAFVAPVNGNYTFTTAGSSYDTVLYLISGCSGREVACNDDAGGTLQSSVNATMSAGQTVIVIVDGYSSSQGSFRLNVSN